MKNVYEKPCYTVEILPCRDVLPNPERMKQPRTPADHYDKMISLKSFYPWNEKNALKAARDFAGSLKVHVSYTTGAYVYIVRHSDTGPTRFFLMNGEK